MKLTPLAVWALLVGVTVAGWLAVEKGGDARLGATVVILVAAFKVNLVISHFMELGWRPPPFRLLTSIWVIGATAIILGGYWSRAGA